MYLESMGRPRQNGRECSGFEQKIFFGAYLLKVSIGKHISTLQKWDVNDLSGILRHYRPRKRWATCQCWAESVSCVHLLDVSMEKSLGTP